MKCNKTTMIQLHKPFYHEEHEEHEVNALNLKEYFFMSFMTFMVNWTICRGLNHEWD
jgi:hypothetical protein